MATDVQHVAFRSMAELNDFMSEHGIDSTDVVNMYADKQTGLHVLWHTKIPDAVAPKVAYSAIADGQTPGIRIPVFIQVSHAAVPKTMKLYYRTTGEVGWIGPVGFVKVGADVYRSWIEADKVVAPSVDYYIEVADKDANLTSKGTAGVPLQFTVV